LRSVFRGSKIANTFNPSIGDVSGHSDSRSATKVSETVFLTLPANPTCEIVKGKSSVKSKKVEPMIRNIDKSGFKEMAQSLLQNAARVLLVHRGESQVCIGCR
jgi:hypothetical protein